MHSRPSHGSILQLQKIILSHDRASVKRYMAFHYLLAIYLNRGALKRLSAPRYEEYITEGRYKIEQDHLAVMSRFENTYAVQSFPSV
jgi:hypothetical protein